MNKSSKAAAMKKEWDVTSVIYVAKLLYQVRSESIVLSGQTLVTDLLACTDRQAGGGSGSIVGGGGGGAREGGGTLLWGLDAADMQQVAHQQQTLVDELTLWQGEDLGVLQTPPTLNLYYLFSLAKKLTCNHQA